MVSPMRHLPLALNARAIASLEGKVGQVRLDVSRLIREMEASTAEADAVIKEMNKSGSH